MRLNPRKLKTIRIMTWAAMLVLTLSFLGLCLLSAGNYTEVAYTKLAVEAGADLTMEASGLGPLGEVMDTTVFYYNITVNVTNPGGRSVKLQYVKYHGAVENYIYEDQFGTNFSFKTSLVEDENYQADSGLVGPRSARSFTIFWQLNKTFMDYFENTQKILNYVLNSTRHLSWDEANWNHYFVFRLVVTGVPTDYYGPDSAYLIELPVIERTQGVNLGQ